MTLLGDAAVAMWWNIAPELRNEFEDWHSHEHFPERLGLPGFRRGSRWRSLQRDGDFFVLYELSEYATLTSREYMARLNDPTPWSTRMMPHHRGMIRSQCVVQASRGTGLGSCLLAVRCAPNAAAGTVAGDEPEQFLSTLPVCPGVTSAHLLVTRTPDVAAPTREQAIRGGDAVADWVILIAGYDADALRRLRDADFSADVGASSAWRHGLAIQSAELYALRDMLIGADQPRAAWLAQS